MADTKYNNTIAAAAMSLGIDPNFLQESLEGLRKASDKYIEVKRDCKYVQIDVIVYGRFLMNDTAKQIFEVNQPIKTDVQGEV